MINALVIDDNRHMADSLCQMLSLFDVLGTPAYGSRAAMEALRDTTPAAVFLDINMPGVTGFEILSYLQREPRLSTTPVFIVTSDDQPETSERAREGGAIATIIKPVELDALETALRKARLIP